MFKVFKKDLSQAHDGCLVADENYITNNND